MKQIIYNKLEEYKLAGWLVFTATRLESMAEQFMFKPMGLTAATFRILMTLNSFGPQSPTELIEILGSSKSNLTQRLNWLAKQSLITLTRGRENDKRKTIAKISQLGKKQLNSTCKLVKENNLHIENYFSKQEKKDFLKLLHQLNKGLDKCQSHIYKHI